MIRPPRRLPHALAALVLFCTTAVASAQDAPMRACALAELPGLSAQLSRARRDGHKVEFYRAAAAILGPRASIVPDPFDAAAMAGVGGPAGVAVACDPAVRLRDRIAWSMTMAGYSTREIADVLGGHLTRADLDQALARLMAGVPKPAVTSFIESRWNPRAEPSWRTLAPNPRAEPSWRTLVPRLPTLDAQLTLLARQHAVSPDLVRAIVAAESGGNPRAVSSAGAIGLMQLMPSTAAALGVNPWEPLENLRGGIAYFASLLRAYGQDVRLALIAYNAGPQHANRVRAGRAVAYEETRRYVEAVAARYPLP